MAHCVGHHAPLPSPAGTRDTGDGIRPLRAYLVALYGVLGAGVLALAWLPIETLLSHLLYDDFFYCLKLAQNLIHRRALSFDGTAPTYVPHPLWVAICTGIQAITDSPIVVHLILTVAAGLHAAQTYVVFRLVSIMTRRHIAHLTAIFYLMNYRLIACSLCGLETPLQALFILLVFHHVLANRGPLGVGSAIRCGGLLGLAVLARIDLLLLAGFVIVWVLIDRSFGERFFRGRLRGAVTICATLLVVALPWSLWSAIRSGTVLPSELVALNLFRFQPFDATHSLAHNLVLLKSKLTLAGWYLSDAANLLGVWPFVHAYDLEGRLGGVLAGLVLGLLGVGIGFTRRSTNHLPRCVMAAYGLAHMGYYVFFAMPEIRYLVPFCIVTILVAASIAGDVSFKLRTVWGSRVGPVVYGVLVIHSAVAGVLAWGCLLYTSPSPRDS